MDFERGSFKFLIALLIFTSIFALILYPLFGFIYYKAFAKVAFIYSVERYVIEPLFFSTAFSLSYWLFDKITNKNNK